jgi:hypothetical protein
LNNVLDNLNHIVFHWEYFLPAIALLCLPLPLTSGRWSVSVSDRQYYHHGLVGLWCAWQNWADLLRSVAGAYALFYLSMTVETKANGLPMAAFLVKAAVLAFGLMTQTIRFGDGLNVFAPICYLSGLTIMLPGYLEGGFAFCFGWAFAIGGRNAKFQLPVMGAALGIMAPILGNFGQMFLLTCGLIITPLLLPVLFRKRVMLMSRGAKGSADEAILREPESEPLEERRPDKSAVLKTRPAPSN